MKKTKPSKEEKQGLLGAQLFNDVVINERDRRLELLKNGIILAGMYEGKLYQGIVESWPELLAQPELLYSVNLVYNLRRIKKLFVDHYQKPLTYLAQIPVERLIILLDVVLTDDAIDEYLEKARSLSPQDFKDEIRELKGISTSDSCKHDLRLWEVCRVCGYKHSKDESQK